MSQPLASNSPACKMRCDTYGILCVVFQLCFWNAESLSLLDLIIHLPADCQPATVLLDSVHNDLLSWFLTSSITSMLSLNTLL